MQIFKAHRTQCKWSVELVETARPHLQQDSETTVCFVVERILLYECVV